MDKIHKAAEMLHQARHAIVFTGAGISVESGIPTFRGKDGLWARYDPKFIELAFFKRNPRDSWIEIKKIFYDFMGTAKPNPAHIAIADLEKQGFIKNVITQNIDNLHQEAGSTNVLEFHGTTRRFECQTCLKKFRYPLISLDVLPPVCPVCGGLIKPDFIFFSEMIPEYVNDASFAQAELADLILVVGTTGEVMPACYIPYEGKRNGSMIIEINPEPSAFTNSITDIYLPGKAGTILPQLRDLLFATSADHQTVPGSVTIL